MMWTPMDLRRLANLVNMRTKSPNDVAQLLGRTQQEVLDKAKEHGLTWDSRYVLLPTPSQSTFHRSVVEED